MPYAVAVTFNGTTLVLSVHPTLDAANAARKASAFSDSFVTVRKHVAL